MKDFIVLDGGLGRELERMGAPFKQPEWSALALMESPESVKKAHINFIEAGADIITTNAYAVIPFHIGQERFHAQGRKLIRLSAELAKQAVDESNREVKIAGCLPPLFGSYNVEDLNEQAATPILQALIEEQQDNADLWLVETLSSLKEAHFICSHFQPADKPVWLAFTLRDRDNRREEDVALRSGETVKDIIHNLPQGIDAVLFNCSHPEEMEDAIQITSKALGKDFRIGVYANTFSIEVSDKTSNKILTPLCKEITPQIYLDFAIKWKENGASIIGGCCGIGPEHIKAIREGLE